MIQKCKRFISDYQLIQPKERVLIALSGGADSVFLLYFLLQIRDEMELDVRAVHVEHGLRGEESIKDARFVGKLCEQYQIPLMEFSCKIAESAQQNGRTIEEEARVVRYRFFEETALKWEADKIAIAHNATDDVETILFHMIRGSGLTGLTGIRPIRERYIRPLLCVTGKEIRSFLDEHGYEYCMDESNQDIRYSRNRIRHCILPQMEEINPGVYGHVADMKKELLEVRDFVEEATKQAIAQYTDYRDGTYQIYQDCFLKEKGYMQNMVIYQTLVKCAKSAKDIERIHVESVRNLMDSQVGKRIHLPYKMVAYRSYRGLEIEQANQEENEERPYLGAVELEIPGVTHAEYWGVTIKTRVFSYNGNEASIPKNQCTKWFDYDIIKKRLVIRKRQPGDYIAIHQDGSLKTIKKLFTDEKVPEKQRNDQMLLMMEDECLWAVGIRMSEAAKVSASTRQILEIIIDGGFSNE